jgi:hypothetical protein
MAVGLGGRWVGGRRGEGRRIAMETIPISWAETRRLSIDRGQSPAGRTGRLESRADRIPTTVGTVSQWAQRAVTEG